ncbi:MAG: hypothetical protein CMA77_05925 [Euryarchaeota archaeon]|nr:hypothetical protein [Euryarchaeota archaeon]
MVIANELIPQIQFFNYKCGRANASITSALVESMWGVIPAAGKGSRITEHHVDGCKELIEINGVTMIHRTIDELREAEVEGIVIVTSPDKPEIEQRLQDSGYLQSGDIHFVEQKEANGLVDAIIQAIPICGQEMLVANPDNLFFGDSCPAAELIKIHNKTKRCVIGIVKVVSPWGEMLSDTGRIGSLTYTENHSYGIVNSILEKRKDATFPLTSPPKWRCTGRMILTNEFWTQNGHDDVEMLQSLAIQDKLLSAEIIADYVDVGIPNGLLYARENYDSSGARI